MTSPLRSKPVLGLILAGGFAAIVVLGSPIISLWLSFFVLGRLSAIGAQLQTHSSPIVGLLPAFLLGLALLGCGWWLSRKNATFALMSQGLGMALLVCNITAFWMMTLVIMPRYDLRQISFEKTAWDHANCYNDRVRQEMLVDLRTQLLGKTREQVLTVLGQPSDGKSSYCLGPEAHIIPVDREFMQPTFNTQGQLIDLKVTGS